jgi:hypothetical protein
MAQNQPVLFKEKSMVFIANQVTQRLIETHLILEHFPTAQRLYQYLHWTMRMSKVAHAMAQFEGRNGGKVLLIDVELHDHRQQRLYALCTPNDVVTQQTQPWQLANLLTAPQLINMLDIEYQALPRGVRAVSRQFAGYRQFSNLKMFKKQLQKMESRRKPMRYGHLKSVKTGNGKKTSTSKGKGARNDDDILTVSFSTFYGAVRRALADNQRDLIPIVSIISKKTRSRGPKLEDFSVDYLLPVQMGPHSVGVVYRDTDCSMVLLDGYDISNKAILCNPSFDIQSLNWFSNQYDRLKVVSDEEWMRSVQSTKSVDSVPMTTPMLGREDSLHSNASNYSVDTVETSNTVLSSRCESRSPILSAYSTQSTRSWSPSSSQSAYPIPAMSTMTDLTLTPPPSTPNMVMAVTPEPVVTVGDVASHSTAALMAYNLQYVNQLMANAMQQKVYFKEALVKNAQFMRELHLRQ